MKRVTDDFFSNNISRLRRHAMVVTPLYLSTIVSAISGLLVVVILANFLTPTEYGNFKYIFSIVGVVSVFSLTGGYRNTVIQSTAKGFDGTVALLARRNFLLSIPMFFIALCMSVYYLFHDNYTIAITIPIVTFSAIVGNYGIMASSYLNGRKKYNLLLLFQVILGITNIGAILLGTLFFDGLIPLIVAISLASIAISCLSLYYVRTYFLRNTQTDSKLTSYGKHLNILNIFSTFLQHIDSVLLFTILGANALAVYALATPFVDRIIGLFKATYFFALPKFTEVGAIHARSMLYQKSIFIFCIGVGITIVYILISPFIFSVLFPQYHDSITLSWLFALNIPLVAFTILPQAYLDSLIEIKNKYIVNSTAFVIRIGSLLVLIPFFGVVGVIWSELITRIVGIAITIILIERYTKKKTP